MHKNMTTTERIIGYDLARAFAILGMMLVNYHLAMNAHAGNELLNDFVHFFYGKAAATFVMLAGIGVYLLSNKARNSNSSVERKSMQQTILKRSLFLLIIGLINYYFWIGDILHVYAFYMSIATIFLFANRCTLLWSSISFFVIAFGLFLIFDFTTGWDFEHYNFIDKWTIEGFLRTTFFNGTNPVFPWIGYFLFGMYLATVNLAQRKLRNVYLAVATLVFFVFRFISFILVENANDWFDLNLPDKVVFALFGTDNIPPLPIAMIINGSFAVMLICTSLYLGEWFKDKLVTKVLVSTGQLSLTIYFAHIFIGLGIYMGLIRGILTVDVAQMHESLFRHQENVAFCLLFSIVLFSVFAIFAYQWKKKHKNGPLEYLMRIFLHQQPK
jgi:uncharacterized membrane protein YeiB